VPWSNIVILSEAKDLALDAEEPDASEYLSMTISGLGVVIIFDPFIHLDPYPQMTNDTLFTYLVSFAAFDRQS